MVGLLEAVRDDFEPVVVGLVEVEEEETFSFLDFFVTAVVVVEGFGF